MLRTYKYRLYPFEEQAERLAHFAGVTRFVYNLALEQRRDFWRQYKRATGGALNYISQGRQVTELRKEAAWIREAPADMLIGALQDLDKAFAAFFRGAGYPQFRKAGINDSFEVKAVHVRCRRLNAKWSQTYVPKIGWVKFRDTRPRLGELRAMRIRRQGGHWFATMTVRGVAAEEGAAQRAVGVDRGVALALACSDGRTFAAPAVLSEREKQHRSARRALSRRKRGSTRHAKQRKVAAAIIAKSARIRADWQHKATTAICRDYGTVVIESLKTKNMTKRASEVRVAQKRGLNRAILNIGWRKIETMFGYKLEAQGGVLVKTNPAYTSQTCSVCGAIDRQSRESQARFACTSCGHVENADINAARNILRQGLAGVEGAGCGPVEARTTQPRLAA